MEAVLLIGAQASGKTTFYRRRFAGTHAWINRDTLGTPARERDALARVLASGQPWVLDRTNALAADRAKTIATAKERGFRVVGYFFRSELKELLARNSRRQGREKIPPAGVIATFKRLQPPTVAEGYDELYTVRVEPGGDFAVEPMHGGLPPAGES